ncbi:MAG: phosphoribosylanthranilate isomerase [Polyangiaceae bacterium]|nr:phosphoribosylanthranilate isomerase [Polyangiaceae bacterium]
MEPSHFDDFMKPWVKICGITTVADAEMLVEAGVSAIGLNFVPSSPRVISAGVAREIVEAVGRRAEVVAVVVDQTREALEELFRVTEVDSVQLHGNESPEFLATCPFPAFKAMRIGSAADAQAALAYGGERILVDAKVAGAQGGTGKSFDWQLIEELNACRRMVLAGGLSPDNVAQAMQVVRPYGVDTASGVESAPGSKDRAKSREFVAQANLAWRK